jgi:hypothetical protein
MKGDEDDPPPDLQAFIRQHGDWRRIRPDVWMNYTPQQQALIKISGAYSGVTAQEWAEWDRLNAEWQARRRERYQKRGG